MRSSATSGSTGISTDKVRDTIKPAGSDNRQRGDLAGQPAIRIRLGRRACPDVLHRAIPLTFPRSWLPLGRLRHGA